MTKTKRAAVLGMLILPALATLAAAQPPPPPEGGGGRWDADANTKGRYSMAPVDGGVMRLDRETGVLAVCVRVGNDIACKGVEDKTNVPQSDELAALRQENKQLKQRIRDMMDDIEAGEPPMGPFGYGPHAGLHGDMQGAHPGPKFEKPTEEQVDQALDYMTRVYKKIRDRVREIDKDQQSTPQQQGSLQSGPQSGPSQAPAAPSSAPTTPPAKLNP